MTQLWAAISAHVAAVTGCPFVGRPGRTVGGGSIHRAQVLVDEAAGRRVFVKLNQATALPIFVAEAHGLSALAATQTLRVPQVIGWGEADGMAYLVLEYLDLGGRPGSAWVVLGERLAALHRHTSAQGYGWAEANFIGSTPQVNGWSEHWATFFVEQRLAYQVRLARRHGGHFPQIDRLLTAVHHVLSSHQPLPSLVHGDLWGGNAGFTRTGEPVIYDPAAYYADREVDLAMTELFGGFDPDFYTGYRAAWPLDSGYSLRRDIYNLYHVLNHFNLFGSTYQAQAHMLIESILRQVD